MSVRHTPIEAAGPELDRIQRLALIVGAAGLVVSALGAALSLERFFQSYLFGFLFWFGIAAGSLSLLMINQLGGGNWGFVIRRPLEAAAMNMPVMALLFIPVIVGIPYLYEWSHPEVANDPILQQKTPYLNVPFFILRAVFYFASWSALAYMLTRWSDELDRSGDAVYVRRMQTLSGLGLVFYVLTMTFAAFDWGMSLDPHWFSTMYGLIFVIGQALAAMACMIVLLTRLADREPLSEIATPPHLHDLGNLLLAFVIIWAYLNFSQYLIVWAGNLPEEIPWYLRRTQGGWTWVILAVIAFQFVGPFLVLLARASKRRMQMLGRVAMVVLLMRLFDLYWLIMPSFHESLASFHWLDLAAPVGIGGIWVAALIWRMKRRPLVPLRDPRDPRLQEALHHG